jgi:hypothetical protein
MSSCFAEACASLRKRLAAAEGARLSLGVVVPELKLGATSKIEKGVVAREVSLSHFSRGARSGAPVDLHLLISSLVPRVGRGFAVPARFRLR